jgi:ATPase subunit of ABC transporter with duplicated ATPase domains
MLTAHQLTKSYGLHTVLQDITFSISAGKRLGLIGPNGCGKTTLLRILAGMDEPDSGTVTHTRPDLRIGYLPRALTSTPGRRWPKPCSTGRDCYYLDQSRNCLGFINGDCVMI